MRCNKAWNKQVRVPKIALVDIETAPLEILTWGLYKQRPTHPQVIKDWCMLSWSAKWLFDPEVMGQHLGPDEAKDRRDKSILTGLWNLLDKADIVVGHNAARFDVRKANARFILNGFAPPMPYQVIDTMKQIQKVGAFPSYSLEYLLNLFNLNGKMKTEYGLWKTCIGVGGATKLQQMSALGKMLRYNKQDVLILEELYLYIRPWMRSHPNLNLLHDGVGVKRCPNCGGTRLERKGEYITPMNRYDAYRCLDCGAIGRDRLSNVSKEKRESLIASVAR